jgi:lipoate-protein ligase A
MKELRYIQCDYSYADYSTSISPAIERSLEEGISPATAVLNIFRSDSITSGYLDDPEKTIDLEYCLVHHILVRRRPNTGGAVLGPKGGAFLCFYLNPLQLGLPLTNIREAFRISLTGIAEAIEELWGIPARYRPLNDVEVEGRKVVPSSARLEKGILSLRLLINVVNTDRETLRQAIKTIPEKVKDKKIKDLGQRFTCLEDEIGRRIIPSDLEALAKLTVDKIFGGEFVLRPGALSLQEERYFTESQDKFNSEEWFFGNSERLRFKNIPADAAKSEGCQKAVAGLIRVTLLTRAGLIHDLIITGDFHPSPYGVIKDMEDALRGAECSLEVVRRKLEAIYARPGVEMAGVEIQDFLAAFTKAFDQGGLIS